MGFLPLSIHPCNIRLAFSSWSQKKRYACENSTVSESVRRLKSERSTFSPLNIQQRPDDFWSVIDCFLVSMLKCVSSAFAFWWFFARSSMALPAIAFSSALSEACRAFSF